MTEDRKFNEKATYIRHTILNHPEIKQWFIDNLEKYFKISYKIAVENLMYKVSAFEINFKQGRDFYEFSYEEMIGMFQAFGSSSQATIGVYISILKKYLDFCIENGYLKNHINLLENTNGSQLSYLVHQGKVRNRIVKREQIYNLVEGKIYNNQDRAFMLLIFEGIKGKENIELCNLKEEDINIKTCEIKVGIFKSVEKKDEYGNIKILQIKVGDKIKVIPRRLMNIIELMMNGNVYYLGNGKYKGKQEIEQQLMPKSECPYLFRPMVRSSGNNLQFNNLIIQRRILSLLKDDDMKLSYVTVTSLYNSGLVEREVKYSKEFLSDRKDEDGGKLMNIPELLKYLKDNDEHVNITDNYNLYKEMYDKL